MRETRGIGAVVMGALYVGFVAWSLYGAVVPIETTLPHDSLAFIYALAFLAYPFSRKAGGWSFGPDSCLRCSGGVRRLRSNGPRPVYPPLHLPEPLDVFFGIAAILLLLNSHGGWWTTPLPWCRGFLLYVYFGRYFPGVLSTGI